MSEPLVTAAERNSELVKRIVEWHRARATAYLTALPGYIADNNFEKARTFTGAMVAHNETIAALMEEAAPVAESDEEPFRDPATRPEGKPHAAS